MPAEDRSLRCAPAASALVTTDETAMCLRSERRISFDGFVSYEGRRFGVPYWYPGKTCRVSREGRVLHAYSADLSHELCALDRVFDCATVFMMKGASFRGAELETLSVESAPNALKVGK